MGCSMGCSIVVPWLFHSCSMAGSCTRDETCSSWGQERRRDTTSKFERRLIASTTEKRAQSGLKAHAPSTREGGRTRKYKSSEAKEREKREQALKPSSSVHGLVVRFHCDTELGVRSVQALCRHGKRMHACARLPPRFRLLREPTTLYFMWAARV